MHRSALLWLLAVTAGVTVANLYYSQPLLAMIGAAFHADAHEAGLIPTLTQAGYAAGMLLIVPLGDSEERKRLLVVTCAISTAVLLVLAMAPSLPVLLAASFALGLITVAPQIVVPYAAALVPVQERGRAIGKVMSGLLVGILLSRTASGLVGAHAGWRAIYYVGFAGMVALTALLALQLPRQAPERRVGYGELLRSLPGLAMREPLLRRHALLGALAFGAFSAFWTTLVYLLRTPPHHYGADVAGLFGIVGVAGAMGAPVAGRLADRYGARLVNGLALCCVLLSWVVFALFWRSLWAIGFGIVLLDLGVQANHIGNQALVLGLSSTYRNRLNTVYMVSYFVGGALGSLLGASAFATSGWRGTSALGLLLSLLGLAAYFGVERRAAFTAEPTAPA